MTRRSSPSFSASLCWPPSATSQCLPSIDSLGSERLPCADVSEAGARHSPLLISRRASMTRTNQGQKKRFSRRSAVSPMKAKSPLSRNRSFAQNRPSATAQSAPTSSRGTRLSEKRAYPANRQSVSIQMRNALRIFSPSGRSMAVNRRMPKCSEVLPRSRQKPTLAAGVVGGAQFERSPCEPTRRSPKNCRLSRAKRMWQLIPI